MPNSGQMYRTTSHPLPYMGTAVSGLRPNESLGHQNHISVVPFLVLEVVECMVDNVFLFFK